MKNLRHSWHSQTLFGPKCFEEVNNKKKEEGKRNRNQLCQVCRRFSENPYLHLSTNLLASGLGDAACDCASTSIKTPIGNQPVVVSAKPEAQSKFLSVKELAAKYGLHQAAIYGFIKTDPTFPYANVGSKKKFLIDVDQFEIWLGARTTREKRDHFAIPTEVDLIAAFRAKAIGGIK